MRFHGVFHKKQIFSKVLKLPSICVATEYPAHDFVNSPWACRIDSFVGLWLLSHDNMQPLFKAADVAYQYK